MINAELLVEIATLAGETTLDFEDIPPAEHPDKLKKLMAQAEVFYVFWPVDDAPDGFDYAIVKGEGLLMQLEHLKESRMLVYGAVTLPCEADARTLAERHGDRAVVH